MAVRSMAVLLAGLLALLLHPSDGARPGSLLSRLNTNAGKINNPFTSKCSPSEESELFNKCLLRFGIQHLVPMMRMKTLKRCDISEVKCNVTRTAIGCVIQELSPKRPRAGATQYNPECKNGIKETLSHLLLNYGFYCTYKDIECKCWQEVPDLEAALRGRLRRTKPQNCPATRG